MPLWDNNNLDDQPVWSAAADFRGGMNTTVLPHVLTDNQYAKGINTTLLKTGRIRTRGGMVANGVMASPATVQGMAYYETGPGTEEVLVVNDNELKVWNNSSFTAVPGYTLTGRVSAFQAQRHALFFSDTAAMYYDGTTVRAINHATIPVVLVTGSGYVVGDLLTLTGGTPEIDAVARVATIGASGEVLTVDWGTGATRGRGYTAAPSGYTGGSGTLATFTYALTTPPAGNIATWHTERVFLAGVAADRDTLYVSDILELDRFPTLSTVTIGSDGEAITGIHSWDNFSLLVFKANSTYTVSTDPRAEVVDWAVSKISSTVGSVSHWATMQVGADVWWLSRDGVQSVRRMIQETQREISGSVSVQVQSYIDDVNWAQVHKASMGYFDNKLFLSFASGTSTDNNTLLVFDTYHQVWSSEWTGPNVSLMVRSKFRNEQRLHFGTDDGLIRTYVDSSEVDTDELAATTDIPTELWFRSFSFGEPVSPKSLLNIELEFTDSTATLDLSLSAEGTPFETVAAGLASSVALLLLPFDLPASLSDGGHYRRAYNLLKYRQVSEAQPKVTAAAGRVSLRALVMSAFIEPMRIDY